MNVYYSNDGRSSGLAGGRDPGPGPTDRRPSTDVKRRKKENFVWP